MDATLAGEQGRIFSGGEAGQLLKLPPHQQHTAARFGGKNTNKRVLSFAVLHLVFSQLDSVHQAGHERSSMKLGGTYIQTTPFWILVPRFRLVEGGRFAEMTKFTAPILRRLNPGVFRYSPSKRARTGPSIILPLLFILRICCVVSRITFLSELTPIIAYHVLHFRWYMQTCIYTFILLHTYNIRLQHTGGVLTFSARLK